MFGWFRVAETGGLTLLDACLLVVMGIVVYVLLLAVFWVWVSVRVLDLVVLIGLAAWFGFVLVCGNLVF